MTPLYIIPARGGSKGIPHKNIKELCGKPLIHYAIDNALAVIADNNTRRIIVSTDDIAIADVATRHAPHITIRIRPAHLATDTAATQDVIIDAMDYADTLGIEYDCIVLLQPTSPLRTAADIRRTLDTYAAADGTCDMAVTVCRSAANPYYDLMECNADGYLHVCKGDGNYTRRQDAPSVWQYNGAVYVIDPVAVRTTPMLKMQRRIPVEMDAAHSIDLDTPDDWTAAENIINRLRQ